MKDKIKNFLSEKFHLKIIPNSAEKEIKTISFPIFYPILGLFIVLIIFISLFIGLENYKTKYESVQTKIKTAKNIASENKFLKKELISLKNDTADLRNSLLLLNEYQHNVYKMLKNEDLNIQNLDIKDLNNLNLPQGGLFKSFEINNKEDLIKNIKTNLSLLEKEIPVQNKRLAEFENSLKKQKKKNRARPNIWPLVDKGEGYISSNFGPRSDPKTKQNAFHEGIDIAVWYNTPVLSTAYGKVVHVGWKGGYGRTVIVDHSQGYKTIYAHLNAYKVKKGEYVKRGDIIALTGNSGRSTGPHLHYEVIFNSQVKNPLDYIGGR